MAPPRSLPELNDDVSAEILLRVAPDEPACLFRASVVCKLWHRIISNPDFRRRYITFHRCAPLLGFFYNLDFPAPFSRFVATTAASPLPKATAQNDDDCRVLWILDCRHGRVLFVVEKAGRRRGLAVWDPIADDWTDLPPPSIRYISYSAVVLCNVADCDHRDCRGGPFLVVYVGLHGPPYGIAACVYSSEDRAWCMTLSESSGCWLFDKNRPAVIGDGIYCSVGYGFSILKYELVAHRFSWISMPYGYKWDPVLMQNEDGSLGFAGVSDSMLYLWSRRWNNRTEGGTAEWVKWRVIELRKVLPIDDKPGIKANVIGFAEGVGVFFISTNVGVFTVEIESLGRVMKVSKSSNNYRTAIPLISFFTPDGAS